MGMDNYSEQLQALTDIRSMMEKSTKFVSLSGISGIAIGLVALLSATIGYLATSTTPFSTRYFHKLLLATDSIVGMTPMIFVASLALLTIAGALLIGLYFTRKKAKQSNIKLWSRSFKQMLLNIAIPLFVGGIFCIALAQKEMYEMIAPATLIFYGLSLINGGKYTLQDVNSLGVAELILGCIALFVAGYGLEFWAIGFGIFHIFYGAKIYLNQEATA